MMYNVHNSAIKATIREAGLFQYEVAKAAGIGEQTLCVWLRDDELPPDRRQMILDAIEKLKADKERR